MKDGEAINWREGFSQLPLDKENKRRGHKKLGGEEFFLILCFFWEEDDNECVKGKLVVMCEEMLFMEANVCKQKKHRRKLFVISSCRGSS
jgi:hypothetical protein